MELSQDEIAAANRVSADTIQALKEYETLKSELTIANGLLVQLLDGMPRRHRQEPPAQPTNFSRSRTPRPRNVNLMEKLDAILKAAEKITQCSERLGRATESIKSTAKHLIEAVSMDTRGDLQVGQTVGELNQSDGVESRLHSTLEEGPGRSGREDGIDHTSATREPGNAAASSEETQSEDLGNGPSQQRTPRARTQSSRSYSDNSIAPMLKKRHMPWKPPLAKPKPRNTPTLDAVKDMSLTATLQKFTDIPTSLCVLADLGKKMVQTLEAIITGDARVQNAGIGHVKVVDFDPRNMLPANIDPDSILREKKDAYISFKRFSSQPDGTVSVSVDVAANSLPNADTCIMPHFDQVTMTHDTTDTDFRAVFENFCKGPPTGMLWYLVGPGDMIATARRPLTLLSAGPWLEAATKSDFSGINTSYFYFSCSEDLTGTSMHVEDCGWLSADIVLCGRPKLWLCVGPAHKAQLEACIDNLYPPGTTHCSQRYCHLSIMLPPSLLDAWHIPYSIKACFPGELIFTMPGAYHQVINLGPNVAEAVNFMLSDTPVHPAGYAFCKASSCGQQNPIGPQHLVLDAVSRRGSDPNTVRPGKRARTEQPSIVRFSLLVGRPYHLNFVRDTPDALLASILSKQVFSHLAELVTGFRNTERNTERDTERVEVPSDPLCDYALIALHDRNTVRADASIIVSSSSSRVSQYRFAEAISKLKVEDHDRLSPAALDQLMEKLELEGMKETRKSLCCKISERSKLRKLCGAFGVGLIILLPIRNESPYYISQQYIRRIKQEDIDRFHVLTKDVKISKVLRVLAALGHYIINGDWKAKGKRFRFEEDMSRWYSFTQGEASKLDGGPSLLFEEWLGFFEECSPMTDTVG